jgi:hypothetical protein
MGSVLVAAAVSASASGVKLCVPNAEGKSTITPVKGMCPKGYTLVELGEEGPTGKTGATGPSGVTGATGPAGATGASGPPGATGPAGVTGAPGAAGVTGVTGVQGATGPTGEPGPTGIAGPTGAAGTSIVNRVTSTGPVELPGEGIEPPPGHSVRVPVPLGSGSWTQEPGELQQLTGQATLTDASPDACRGAPEVVVFLDGQEWSAEQTSDGTDPEPGKATTVTLVRNGPESARNEWLEEPIEPITHTISAYGVYPCADTAGVATLDSLRVDVIGIR